jgi:hypothetical protein
MNLHTDTNNVICTIFFNESEKLTIDTMNILPLKQEQIEADIASNNELLLKLQDKKLDGFIAEADNLPADLLPRESDASNSLNFNNGNLINDITKIIDSAASYPGFLSLMKNISKGHMRFDIEHAKKHYKKNLGLFVVSFSYSQQRFSNVLSFIDRNVVSLKLLKEIEEVLEEKSKKHTVSVLLSRKACVFKKRNAGAIFIDSEKNKTEDHHIFFTEMMRAVNIINATFIKESTKVVLILETLPSATCYIGLINILFRLCAMNKIIEQNAKAHKFGHLPFLSRFLKPSKPILFYSCEGYSELLNILYSIASKY